MQLNGMAQVSMLDDSDCTGESGGKPAVIGSSAEVDGNLSYSLELLNAAFRAVRSPFTPWNFS
jgi:hypothetical protein